MANYMIFGKKDCQYTQKALKDFKKKCVPFVFIDVDNNPHGLEKMLEYSNDKYVVPVIVEVDEGNVQIGYSD